jgi:aminoglycoside phosphotransferase (APT) family kinase protein
MLVSATVAAVTDTAAEITPDLIAQLLRDQHPDLADLPLTFGARGWDNQLWRLGDELAVRLPWQATRADDELLVREHTLLPQLAPRLPLPTPVPQRLGKPANLLTRDGDLCGVVDFGDVCAGDPACDLSAGWLVLPDGAVERFQRGYPAADAATWRRARGWALWKALACLLIGDAGVHGRPGGKATWGPPAAATLRRLVATN